MADIRVRTVREVVYQGPEEWVKQCLDAMLSGTLGCGEGRMVSGALRSADSEPVDPAMVPDIVGRMSAEQYVERMKAGAVLVRDELDYKSE